MSEIRGKYIRASAYREGSNIFLEIANIWDPCYEKPVVLISSEANLEKQAEELIQEFSQIVRELVERILKEKIQDAERQ